MFAIVKTGGKQYKIRENDTIRVEKLDASAGDRVVISDVLLANDGQKTSVGAPFIKGASAEATVVEQIRDKKVLIFKKKRRHNYRRKKGHRQPLTVLKIERLVFAS